jgi:hypothetical protein
MGYRIEVDRERRLARVTLFGVATAQEQITWVQELVRHPNWLPGFNLLVDARGLVAPLRYDALTRVTHVTRQLDEQLGTGCEALVGDTDLLYGCCRMGERVCQPCSREIASFRSVAEAERWLGVGRDETTPHSGTRARGSDHPPAGRVSDSGRPL